MRTPPGLIMAVVVYHDRLARRYLSASFFAEAERSARAKALAFVAQAGTPFHPFRITAPTVD